MRCSRAKTYCVARSTRFISATTSISAAACAGASPSTTIICLTEEEFAAYDLPNMPLAALETELFKLTVAMQDLRLKAA